MPEPTELLPLPITQLVDAQPPIRIDADGRIEAGRLVPSDPISVWRKYPDAKLPESANDGAVGLDVFAYCMSESGRPLSRAIHQRNVTVVETGIVLVPPPGFYFQCCSRSGLARKGVFVANAPGIIDPDYTGELIILLYNGSHETHYISHGHRIAQLILCPIVSASLVEVDTQPTSSGRGEAGFGSTGL